MLRVRLVLILLFALIVSQTAPSVAQVSFSLSPASTWSLGNTSYVLRADPFKSKLVFPLDAVMMGGEFGCDIAFQQERLLKLECGIFISVTDPFLKMKDHDWVKLNGGELKFSYTESDVGMRAVLLRIEGSMRVFTWRMIDIEALGGFRYHHIEQDIIGYEGWQLDENLSRVNVKGSEPAIEYWIKYYLPFVGVRCSYRPDQISLLDLKLACMGVLASDYDDHLLRYKTATADVVGGGAFVQARGRREFGDFSRPHLYADLFIEIIALWATGDQQQRWYGDDPITPDEDDTGTVISGIPHDISSIQVTIGFKLGWMF